MPKTIACVWEIGAGLGHLTRLRPMIKLASEAGHRVFLVSKELNNIHAVFDVAQLALVQAPYDTTPIPRKLPISWSEMLLLRYRAPERLANYLSAWRSIFALIEPDLVVYDSSPTALIASLGSTWTKWSVGSPFFMPRIDMAHVGVFPLADSGPNTVRRLKASEQSLLALLRNSLRLMAWSAELEGVRDVVAQCDLQLVTSLPQFDYFGPRRIGEYVGMPASIEAGTAQPDWPEGSGLKVFAYLKGCPGMQALLTALDQSGVAAVIYSRDISQDDRKKHCRHVYLDSPASMDAVCDQADLVIHMAGSQTVARCMLAGVSQLLIATGMEQLFTAKAAQSLGAAFVVDGSSSSFDDILRQALIDARKGRRPFESVKPELLDGSLYDARVAAALATFLAA